MNSTIKTAFKMGVAILTLSLITAPTVNAHHTRSNFDQSNLVTITGEVTELAWANPHVFIEVAAEETIWLVESYSVTGMRRRGWEANSLKPGDQVILTGAPDKNPSKKIMSLSEITYADGSPVVSLGLAPPAKRLEPSVDFSGTWSMDLSYFDTRGASGPPPMDWPYTPEGRRQAEAYNINESPELKCQDLGVPRMMIYPYSINLVNAGKSLNMVKEHLNETRTIWFNAQDAASANEPASPTGTSVGTMISDRELHIKTHNFVPTQWGAENALSSSNQKTVEEIYKLSEDRFTLDVTLIISDPVLFTKPVMREIRFRKEADREFALIPCDPRAADRHVTMAKSGRKVGQSVAVVAPDSNKSSTPKKSWWQRLVD